MLDDLTFDLPSASGPLKALVRMAPDEVERRVWTFGRPDRVVARQVRLLADGRVSGTANKDDHSWGLRDGVVTLFDRDGVPTVRFDRASRDEYGIVLCGRWLKDPAVVLVLAETRPAQALAADMSGFPIDRHVSNIVPGRRRNLVVVFGNQDSLHRRWQRDIAEADRTWDLCVSFYGPQECYDEAGTAEFSSLQTGIYKCRSAHAAFAIDSPFWAYERVWFADDDLMVGWRDINLLFSIAAEHDLLLAQPALIEGSYVAHSITRQQPGKKLRYVSFVESMAPVFTREALRLCLPVYQNQRHGYGTDYVWPWLLSAARDRLAIIDKVGVMHTRPQTKAHSPGSVGREEYALLSAYSALPVIEEYGFLGE